MAGHFRRFAALPEAERRLLLHAAIVVASMRAAVLVFPFRWVCDRLRAPRLVSDRLAAIPVGRLAWAVSVAARCIPGASCLTQALTLQWLLLRAGKSGIVRVGVAKDGRRGIEAHAWVEHGDKVILGGDEDPGRFTTILALRGRAS